MLPVLRLLVSGAVLLSACSVALCSGQETPPVFNRCVADDQISSQDSAFLSELQSTTEKGLLYTIPAASIGVKECRISNDSGVLQLKYRFKDGGWLLARRDNRIEYSMREARFTLPSTENPVAILKGELRGWFGAVDSGIDWNKPEIVHANDDANAMETVYRGKVCNCTARIRRDSNNRVIGLTISSAC